MQAHIILFFGWIFSLHTFAGPSISARVGYLEAALPSLELLQNMVEGLLDNKESRNEAAHSIKSWDLVAYVHFNGIEKGSNANWVYEPIAQLQNSLDEAKWSSGKLEPASTKSLQTTVDILKNAIAAFRSEISNPQFVDRKSAAYFKGLSDGLELTFAFFEIDQTSDATSIRRMTESRDASVFLNSINLSQLKMRGMQIALRSVNAAEIENILESYIHALEAVKSNFPGPTLFAGVNFRNKVREAAAALKDVRNQYSMRLHSAFEVRRKTIARGWTSPHGSCLYSFRVQ